MKLLLDYGAAVDAEIRGHETALSCAVALDNAANIVKLLLDHGADIEKRVNNQETRYPEDAYEARCLSKIDKRVNSVRRDAIWKLHSRC